MSWQELEEYTKEFLDYDDPKLPKGSGSTKREEDIITNNIVAQCKFTENENITIKEKDITRLLSASSLQEKLPIFINECKNYKVISFIVEDNTEEIIKESVKFASIKLAINTTGNLINTLLSVSDINQLPNHTVKKVDKKLTSMKKNFSIISNTIQKNFEKCSNALQALYNKFLMIDLFTG